MPQSLEEVREKLNQLSKDVKADPVLKDRLEKNVDAVLADRGISEPIIKELRRERSPVGEFGDCFSFTCICTSNCANALTITGLQLE